MQRQSSPISATTTIAKVNELVAFRDAPNQDKSIVELDFPFLERHSRF